MAADLAESMVAARVSDVRATASGAVGRLGLRPRGLARLVAAVEAAELRLQAQLLPARPDDAGWRAAEAFLSTAAAQVEGVEVAAGCAREQGVAWLQVSGPVEDAARLVLVAAALGTGALGRANALLSEPALAAAYLQMRCGETPGEPRAGERG